MYVSINYKDFLSFCYVISIRNEQFLQKLGRRIIVLRHEKGLSQEELANLSDISIVQIGRIERGKINCTVSTLRTIALGLNIHLSVLLHFDYD